MKKRSLPRQGHLHSAWIDSVPAGDIASCISSQEDAAPIVRPRAKKLLRARGIADFPETLAFAVHKGIDFDSPEWRERFFQDVVLYGFELVIIDRFEPTQQKPTKDRRT